MALAKFRKVYDRQGSGRFVVSEGVAPSEYLLPHDALATLYEDSEDDRFETVITKGTILGVVQDANGDSRIVPCGGGGLTTTDFEDGDAGLASGGDANASTPIGAAQYDLHRPFDKGTSQGSGWITHGYVEWPLVNGSTGEDNDSDPYADTSFDNTDLAPGAYVKSDGSGRPVLWVSGTDDPELIVGKVIAREEFGTNFDDGLLSYMQLPSDPGAVKHVYELTKAGDYQGRLGIRANLNVTGVVGAVRVSLTI